MMDRDCSPSYPLEPIENIVSRSASEVGGSNSPRDNVSFSTDGPNRNMSLFRNYKLRNQPGDNYPSYQPFGVFTNRNLQRRGPKFQRHDKTRPHEQFHYHPSPYWQSKMQPKNRTQYQTNEDKKMQIHPIRMYNQNFEYSQNPVPMPAVDGQGFPKQPKNKNRRSNAKKAKNAAMATENQNRESTSEGNQMGKSRIYRQKYFTANVPLPKPDTSLNAQAPVFSPPCAELDPIEHPLETAELKTPSLTDMDHLADISSVSQTDDASEKNSNITAVTDTELSKVIDASLRSESNSETNLPLLENLDKLVAEAPATFSELSTEDEANQSIVYRSDETERPNSSRSSKKMRIKKMEIKDNHFTMPPFNVPPPPLWYDYPYYPQVNYVQQQQQESVQYECEPEPITPVDTMLPGMYYPYQDVFMYPIHPWQLQGYPMSQTGSVPTVPTVPTMPTVPYVPQQQFMPVYYNLVQPQIHLPYAYNYPRNGMGLVNANQGSYNEQTFAYDATPVGTYWAKHGANAVSPKNVKQTKKYHM